MSLKEKYTLEITRKLDYFKNAKEWPDFISLLTSIDTTIETYSLPFIPKLEYLSKRLNQCLNPLLPAGVHLKALETYSIIFSTISEDDFISNFGVYTLGLFNFGINSRVLVLSSYLSLLDKFIIPLGVKIESFTINVLYGILPSIDTDGEYYKIGLDLLSKYKDLIDKKVFYISMWQIFLQNVEYRLSVILFLMNEPLNYEEMVFDKILVIRALKEGLRSEDLLILRNTLNLILYMFPSKNLSSEMNCEILEGMFQIFTKREQSLNKRIFQYLSTNEEEEFKEDELDEAALDEEFKEVLDDLKDEDNVIDKEEMNANNIIDEIIEAKMEDKQIINKIEEDTKIIKKSEKTKLGRLDKIINKTLLRILRNPSTTQSFFKIFITLSDKNKLTEKILEGLLFEVLVYTKDYKEKGRPGFPILERSKVMTQQDVIDLSRHFVTTDLDRLWKILYLELKKALSNIKEESYSSTLSIINSVSSVMKVINFCLENYNVYDDTVLNTHLPFLTSFILNNYTQIDKDDKYEFLNKNIKKMILKDQILNIPENFFDLIDEFYTKENIKILQKIHPSCASCIGKFIIKYIDEENYKICLDFYEFNKIRHFRQEYYNWMINKSTKVIKESMGIFDESSGVNSKILFRELWYRFVNSQENVKKSHENVTDGNEKFNNESLLDKKLVEFDNKKTVSTLIYEYNKIFNRKYERLLIKKIYDQNIITFLKLILNNQQGHFYNIFYIVNCKTPSQDPQLKSLIKSIYNFKEIFQYIVNKYKEDKNSKGILKIIKNIVENSEIFRTKINELWNEENVTYKNIVFDILITIYLRGEDEIIKDQVDQEDINEESNEKDELNNIEIINEEIIDEEINENSGEKDKSNKSCRKKLHHRNLKIRAIKIIQYLIKAEIINKFDIAKVNFESVINLCRKYKNDPALILPTGDLLELKDDSQILNSYSEILYEECFYFDDLLNFIFNLDTKHKIIIFPNLLENVKDGKYSFTIYNLIINKMLDLNYTNFNWAQITKSMIKKFIFFYETNFEESDDVYTRRQKIQNIDELSISLFNTFSGYFIEYLINSKFSSKYISNLSFRERLYSGILSSYAINQDKTFKFLMDFDSILTEDELLEIHSKFKMTLYQITNYRSFSDFYTLLYLLRTYSLLLDEHSQLLSTIYQTISCMQKNDLNESEIMLLLDFLCKLQYTSKIRSALLTFLSYFFNLLKKFYKLIDKLLILLENPTITVKNMKNFLLDYLDTKDFFLYEINKKSYIYKQLINIELNIMDDLIYKLESSFFVSQVSDINIKCNVLKRIAFLIFSNDFNKFLGFIPKMIELIVNFIQHNSTKVRKQIWFLIKIICVKIHHSKLLPLFPVIFTEILTFLNQNKIVENFEYLEICKLMDLIFLVNSCETFEFKNFCIGTSFRDEKLEEKNQEINDTNKQLRAYPLFTILYKKLSPVDLEISKNLENQDTRHLFFTQKNQEKRKLFFTQKNINLEDILRFFKSGAEFYNLQDTNNQVIDVDLLEKTLILEFQD
ncbi:protein DOPEY1 [Vairimorpha necatrix]|uniref:Protein DOPEY1 n=1 Tax=Vairimorpha necatrix TaxID=6039 RepID=A0AAX4J8E8_9MICR